MTLREFARSVIASEAYRQSVIARAAAGTLPPDVEALILELADDRTPMSSVARVPAAQSPTLALIRSSAVSQEEDV